MKTNTKVLCKVKSIEPRLIHEGAVYKNVPVKWSRLGRRKPVVCYRNGIKGYNPEEMNVPVNVDTIEEGFNRLFTKEEVNQFRHYIERTRHRQCKVEELKLPIAPYKVDTGLELDMAGQFGDEVGWVYASLEEGYDLPFHVAGYALCEEGERVFSLSEHFQYEDDIED